MSAAGATATRRRYSSPAIVVRNLDAAIAARHVELARRRLDGKGRVALFQLLSTRGDLLGRISDHDVAATVVASDGNIRHPIRWEAELELARAASAARFHRFDEAMRRLDVAAAAEADPTSVTGLRATVWQAVGHVEAARRAREELAASQPGVSSVGALAVLEYEVGDRRRARDLLDRAYDLDTSVSPVPVVSLAFQWGVLALRHDDLSQAGASLSWALELFPDHGPARCHLAQVRLREGRPDLAAELVGPLVDGADDPEYVTTLAAAWSELGRSEEARRWVETARFAWEELLERHPEAYWDHAADFYLTLGDRPARGLVLAEQNLLLRDTPRAQDLLTRARRRCGQDC